MFQTVHQHRTICAIAILFASGCFAADRQKYEIDPESTDGALLQQILQDRVPAHRLELLERYAQQFPRARSSPWVQEQLVRAYSQAQNVERLLATAEKLLALDPADLETANLALRAAGTRPDPQSAARWALQAWDTAQRASQAPNADAAFIQDVVNYAAYVLYTAAHQSADSANRVEYLTLLEQHDPKNEYARSARPEYMSAVLQSTSHEQKLPFLEKELATSPDDEDALFLAAQEASRENLDSLTLKYALRLLSVLEQKPKPQGMSDGDWSNKRFEYISSANWFAGTIYSKMGEFGVSNRHLTAALAYLHEKPGMLAAAYYYLGYNNYTVASDSRDPARAKDAYHYNQLCAEMKSPYQASAQKNLEALKTEFHLQ
jgi:hypothetical protein